MNLVKDSLLNIVHIIFAHAARTAPRNGSTDRGAPSTTDSRASGASRIAAVHAQVSTASGPRRSSSQRARENGRAHAVAESLDRSAEGPAGGKGGDAGETAGETKKPGYGQSAAGHILMFLVKLAKVCALRVSHANAAGPMMHLS